MLSSSSVPDRSGRPLRGASAQASTSCWPTCARKTLDAAAKVLSDAGFEVSTAIVDVSSRTSVHALVETATAIGTVTGVIHAAGRLAHAGIAGHDPEGRSVWHRARARGIRQRHRARRGGRRHRLAVGAPPPGADARAEQGAGDDARRRVACASDAPAGPRDGPAPRLPGLQARKLAAGDGRGGAVGQARRASQHDQPRHHLHASRQGRADRPARRRHTGA